ncbi:MAG: hypothetical protein U9O85_08820 [Euryarchaeota archaeon]|nr:hypothetical protein [Euryarchaeota archaeon]
MAAVDIVQEVISNKKGWESGEKYLENALWLKDHLKEVEKKYEGQVVIVRDEKIVFSSKSPDDVRAELQALDTYERNQSYIFYLPKENEIALW